MAKMLASQMLALVIRPALGKIGLWSRAAEELVLGTAIVESGLTSMVMALPWASGGLSLPPMTTFIPTS